MIKYSIIILLFITSCNSLTHVKNLFKGELTVQQVIDFKQEMDNSGNPAFVFQQERMLQKKRVGINDAVVQDIVSSDNVDYRFCVKIRVPVKIKTENNNEEMNNIECYVYAESIAFLSTDLFPKEDIKTVSKLRKGITKIDVEGDFSKFLPSLDESYTKIEIVNADVEIND